MNANDPRPQWDSKDAEVDQREAERERYLQVARELGDDASITLAATDLENLRSARAAYRTARVPLDETMTALASAEGELAHAQALDALGTLDAREAVKRYERVIVAAAKVRHLAAMLPGLIASAAGVRQRVSLASHVATAREVVEETVDLGRKLLEYTRVEGAFNDAAEIGTRSNAARAAWWPIGEQLARVEFETRLAREKAAASDTGVRDLNTGRFIRDSRREERVFPTAADLEQCFQRRRQAFAAERARVEAQLAALTGQVQELGGAA
jgi:hypothetical protein